MSIPSRLASTLLLLLLIILPPVPARVINLGTAAPVPDRSDASVARALQGALDGCVRQAAAAKGLPWIRTEDAFPANDQVVVQVIATDAAEEAQRPNMVPGWDL